MIDNPPLLGLIHQLIADRRGIVNAATATMDRPARKLFSADSNVVEPGNCYIDNIEQKYRDRAPHFEKGEKGGEFFVIDGRRFPSPAAQFASSGLDLSKADFEAMRLDEANIGAYDPKQRLHDQDRDGVLGDRKSTRLNSSH